MTKVQKKQIKVLISRINIQDSTAPKFALQIFPKFHLIFFIFRLNLKSNYQMSHQFQAFQKYQKQIYQNQKLSQRKSRMRMKWPNQQHGHPNKYSYFWSVRTFHFRYPVKYYFRRDKFQLVIFLSRGRSHLHGQKFGILYLF